MWINCARLNTVVRLESIDSFRLSRVDDGKYKARLSANIGQQEYIIDEYTDWDKGQEAFDKLEAILDSIIRF